MDLPDGSVRHPNGEVTLPNGQSAPVGPDGCFLLSDGTQLLADGSLAGPRIGSDHVGGCGLDLPNYGRQV